MIRINHLHDVTRAPPRQSNGLHRAHSRRQSSHSGQLDIPDSAITLNEPVWLSGRTSITYNIVTACVARSPQKAESEFVEARRLQELVKKRFQLTGFSIILRVDLICYRQKDVSEFMEESYLKDLVYTFSKNVFYPSRSTRHNFSTGMEASRTHQVRKLFFRAKPSAQVENPFASLISWTKRVFSPSWTNNFSPCLMPETLWTRRESSVLSSVPSQTGGVTPHTRVLSETSATASSEQDEVVSTPEVTEWLAGTTSPF